MTETPYITFEKEFLKIRTLTNRVSGEKVEMTGNMKILYRYMLDRYLFFRALGGDFYDNQDELADSLAMTRRTVISLIQSMIKVGLVEKKMAKRRGANNSNAYVVFDIFDKTKFDTVATASSCLPKVVRKPQYTESQPIKPAPKVGWIEDENCPF